MENIALIIFGVFGFYAVMGLRIAQGTERFAVLSVGQFKGLKGPGLLLKWPGSPGVWRRIRIADEGKYQGDGWALFGDESLPVRPEGDIELGQRALVSSFRNAEIWVRVPSSSG